VTPSNSPSSPTGARVQTIDSTDAAQDLAHRLLLPGRALPTVVVTIAAGQTAPFADPAEILDAVGDLADVVVLAGGGPSIAFSNVMPEMTTVYGGAGRVYPVDHEWVSRPLRSPLRFAYSLRDRPKITEHLINDALAAALAGGALALSSRAGVQQRTGKVAAVVASRALVVLDDGVPVSVWEELTVPGLDLARVLEKGQRVAGSYDPGTRRLDVRGALRTPEQDLAEIRGRYTEGDLVLADVAEISDEAVLLRLLPAAVVEVARAAVTANPDDSLAGLFTAGEVVTCRIVSLDPLQVRLDDVDPGDLVLPAPPLLAGGPAWLNATPGEKLAPITADPLTLPGLAVHPSSADLPAAAVPAAGRTPAADPQRPPAATPALLARRATGAAIPAAAGADSVQGLMDRVTALTRELAAERTTRQNLAGELGALREHAGFLEDRIGRLTVTVGGLQTRYRNAELARQRLVREARAAQNRAGAAGAGGHLFTDAQEQFRHEVYLEWVTRIPAAEKAAKPLSEYTLGPDFLASLEALEGVSRSKVVAVVVEVLTGQAPHLAGREPHQLRGGQAAGAAYVTRADGATCWRVALQQETAGARRMHYWRARDRYEFSRVVHHDDFRP
jgi:hypothetical protein